ncbi:hypothetical protein [Jannaschia formosa]|uniref:hypothetical protein n=1 Tax=Jannaschia formosa TaxID=2259592 RepID=UPI000E1C2731|nr:hypothetical protein [Jannaschia formosa]TFL18750.1 hypothetical protein DR046_07435 [Jannaschia formosa]
MRDDRPERVEDYTEAFLWTAYMILIVALVMIWGIWGYLIALATCAGLHWGITRWSVARARAEAEWDARVAAALARARAREEGR